MARPLCRHCHKEPATRPRGLGRRCYYAPGVRDLYHSGRHPQGTTTDDMTDDELDAVIAEQRRNPPKWWPTGLGGQGDPDDKADMD